MLLCHGFPETSYAWRYQLPALAAAGLRAVAPDLRGYGGTERPETTDAYTILHLIGDLVALLDALGERTALIVGSDWGATIAWAAAQLRPDRFVGVVALGVPLMARAPLRPTLIFPQNDEALFYTLWFQQPGVAEAEFSRDPRTTLRRIFHAGSGEAGPRRPGDGTPNPFGFVPRRDGLLAHLPEPKALPAWLTTADLDSFAAAFAASGFRGGLDYYRNLDRNWEIQAAFEGLPIRIPALFMVGERDAGLQIPGMRDIIAGMHALAPSLEGSVTLAGAGHWLSQERPREVTDAVLRMARAV